MKTYHWTVAAAGVGLLVALIATNAGLTSLPQDRPARDAADDRNAAPADAATPFAVIELFTSEGCSSCPPADDVLAEFVADARKNGRRIYPLAFHVDYWNYIGWNDPFSRADFSERQKRYNRALKLDRNYTPQMIVNGATEFVGSDAPRAKQAVAAALESKSPVVPLKIILAGRANDRDLVIEYDAGVSGGGAAICAAFVERGLSSDVRRGENRGRVLKHENVVRAFSSENLVVGKRGTLKLSPPAGAKRENASIIAFVQDRDSMAILGATAIDLAK